MKILGYTLHALTIATILLAVWTPIGSWWQWTITAIVLFLAGAITLGSDGLRHHGTPQGDDESDQNPANGAQVGSDDSERSTGRTADEPRYDKGGNVPGPTVVKNDTDSPEQIVRHDRPRYGKPGKEGDR